MKKLLGFFAVVLMAISGLFVGGTVSPSKVDALSSCSSQTYYNNGRWGGRAVCTSAAGPATSYAVIVRCEVNPTVWHFGHRRFVPGSYGSTYSEYYCLTGQNVVQVSIYLYF